MKPKKKVEKAIRGRLRFTAGATFRDRLLADVMNAQEEFKGTGPTLHEPGIRRRLMRSPVAKLTSIAAVIAVAALSIVFSGRFSTPAYAIEQTVEALQNVRFLHIIGRDKAGEIKDERWIEIGEDGYQVRYRQQNPASVIEKHPGAPSMVIEDGESTAVYRQEKKAVILYDRKEMQYQWVGELGKAFENLRTEGQILQEDSEYQGRRAHKVWWPYMSAECYVDPETKLPMAIGDTELSYEEPPAGTWEITIPDGYAVLDKRAGAPPTTASDWLVEEENAQKNKRESFNLGAQALMNGDYAEAAKQFEQALGWDSWATFWLGSAYYELGQYDLAAKYFTEMLNTMLKAFGGDVLPYCNYALGLAQARAGNLEAATANFEACLPAMIQTLRIPSGGRMFEYADNPKIRYGQHKPSDQEMVVKMVNRLRLITGQNFGYDPTLTNEQNEGAIAAWEQWFQTDGQIQFTPDAELLPVPQWLLGEENAHANKRTAFHEGSLAFARGDYAEAAQQFEQALGWDSWAPFWLGSAYYHLGEYDLAIENYNQEFEIWTKHDPKSKLPYCNYARGLAYARSGNLEAAKADFQACLPEMIRTLRIPSGGGMFEYAENTMVRYGQGKLSDEEMVVKMINRLRLITGQNFGYDPTLTNEQNEGAIAAWEQWFQTDGQIQFTPDAELLPVPVSSDGDQTNTNN